MEQLQTRTMGVTINKKSTTTEQPPKYGQQYKPLGALNAFYRYQIFALDSAVGQVQEMSSLHRSLLCISECSIYIFTSIGPNSKLSPLAQKVQSSNRIRVCK